MPVITVPAPASVKERSTARRKRPRAVRAWIVRATVEQALAQFADALASYSGSREDICTGKCRSVEQLLDLVRHLCALNWPSEIGFSQHHDATFDAKEVDDSQMLARLRHDAVIDRNHQQHDIDAGGAG